MFQRYLLPPSSSTLLMEAASTSETWVNFYQTTRRYNPDDSHLHTHHRKNLKSYLLKNYLLTILCGRNMWHMGAQSLPLHWGPLHSWYTTGVRILTHLFSQYGQSQQFCLDSAESPYRSLYESCIYQSLRVCVAIFSCLITFFWENWWIQKQVKRTETPSLCSPKLCDFFQPHNS
jgi:hypothetical protein